MGSAATDPCVHCGFCLPTCASYRVIGSEMDSPRGRIHTIKALERGELELDATVASHFDSCLGCLACVSACPSGVRYDELIEATRPKLNAPELRSPGQQALRRLLFSLLPYPGRLRALLQPLRLYAGSALQTQIRRSKLGRILGPQLEAMEQLLPELTPASFRDPWPVVVPAQGERRGRVGLVLGCVQRVFDPDVNGATIRVLSANGLDVVIPPAQGCCGAVTHHQGELQQTIELAQQLICRFEAVVGEGKPAGPEPLDAVLVAASGCGHTLKHYPKILEGVEGWHERAQRFGDQIFDVQEYLHRIGLSESFQQRLQPLHHPNGERASAEQPLVVAYHDACHMLHGQGIKEPPRSLLNSIPHLELREASEAGLCCGSAGIYNITQPDEAAALGVLKATDLAKTGACRIASANIGCSLQIRRHLSDLGHPIQVAHPMELLDQSLA
ncbi:MAG: (Fe-S)-binding protein [Vulcanococcus sp.]